MTAKLMKLSGRRQLPIKQPPTASMTRTTTTVSFLLLLLPTLKPTDIGCPANSAPFATQFFQDDDFGGGFDDDGGFDGEGRNMPDDDAGEQDLLAATQGQTRRVRPELVNYARRAKRVDVRKLKDNIWKGLGIVIPKDDDDDDDDDDRSMVSDFSRPFEICLSSPNRMLTSKTWSLPIPQNLDNLVVLLQVCRRHIRETRWRKSAPRFASSVYFTWQTNKASN